MKKFVWLSVAVLALVIAVGFSQVETASAGEIAGNGERIEVNGHSICAFSGLNDEFIEDGTSDYRTQTPGDHEGSGPSQQFTGYACNPTNEFGH